MNHGLAAHHLEIIRTICAPYAETIQLVGLFGSRATGNFTAYSDIDLVIYGNVKETEADRIRTLFQESLLPFTVDIVLYNDIAHAPLKAHIDAVMQPLFTQKEL